METTTNTDPLQNVKSYFLSNYEPGARSWGGAPGTIFLSEEEIEKELLVVFPDLEVSNQIFSWLLEGKYPCHSVAHPMYDGQNLTRYHIKRQK